ncbi:MAG TPA: hypothetical protein VI792_04985 [Candidatus Eisenbacteria bacterium]
MLANLPSFRWARVGIAALLLGVQLDGCATAVGTQGVASSDEPALREDLHLTSLSPGTQVRVILRGDSLVSGKFSGVSRMGPEAYGRRVAEFRAARTDSTPLPASGSAIRVRRGSRDQAALLDGFGYRSLELRWKESGPPRLLPFDEFTAVTDSTGHVWTRDALDMEAIRGRVPCFTVIEVETETGPTQVPVDQVTTVAYRTPEGQWVAGAVVVVALVVVIAVIIAKTTEPRQPQCQGSGPTWLLRNPGVRAAILGNLRDSAAVALRD